MSNLIKSLGPDSAFTSGFTSALALNSTLTLGLTSALSALSTGAFMHTKVNIRILTVLRDRWNYDGVVFSVQLKGDQLSFKTG